MKKVELAYNYVLYIQHNRKKSGKILKENKGKIREFLMENLWEPCLVMQGIYAFVKASLNCQMGMVSPKDACCFSM